LIAAHGLCQTAHDLAAINLFSRFRKSASGARRPSPHMTWATSSVGRTVSRTALLLKRQIWIWPIIAVLLLSAIGWGVRHAIETTMKDGLRSELQTLLDTETAMLETWLREQRSNAEALANSVDVRQDMYKMLETPPSTDASSDKSATDLLTKLDKTLAPAMTAHNYIRYFVADKSKRIIAATSRELIGRQDIVEYDSFLQRALSGSACVSTPFPSVVALKDENGRLRTGVPTMFVAAPVRDESF
jgi:eukaryotic-like serine/threonine-protein kinase